MYYYTPPPAVPTLWYLGVNILSAPSKWSLSGEKYNLWSSRAAGSPEAWLCINNKHPQATSRPSEGTDASVSAMRNCLYPTSPLVVRAVRPQRAKK